MGYTLRSSDYSFVPIAPTNWYNTNCAPLFTTCWPMVDQDDIRFQLIVEVSGADKDIFNIEDGEGFKWAIQAKICGDQFPAGVMSYTATWTKISEGTTDVWRGDFYYNGVNTTLWDEIEVGDCFQLCFHLVQYSETFPQTAMDIDVGPLANSWVCFQRTNEVCFNSLWEYANNEDAFGFYYTDTDGEVNWFNRIRIPCYVRDMQLAIEEKTYIKSNGSHIKLFERIDEDYELSVDWLQKNFHKCIKVMLAHDLTYINNFNDAPGTIQPNDLVRVVCREKYEITWPEMPYSTAPAKTRLKLAEPLHLLNTNCRP